MIVNTEQMEHNLELTEGLVYSQQVLLYLINKKGLTREDAYEKVQKCAHYDGKFSSKFQMRLLHDDVLSMAEVEEIFDIGYYTKNVDYIFKKVFRN